MSIHNHLPPLRTLAARLNRETPYRCVCRDGGAEIYVADTTLWFDETSAREVLSAVLFAGRGTATPARSDGGARRPSLLTIPS